MPENDNPTWTEEWKKQVQAEAAGKLTTGIAGIGQTDQKLDTHAQQTGISRDKKASG